MKISKDKIEQLKHWTSAPDAFCPECLSLARKPNKGCKNHNKVYEQSIKKREKDIKIFNLK